jgi:hypothetical protein
MAGKYKATAAKAYEAHRLHGAVAAQHERPGLARHVGKILFCSGLLITACQPNTRQTKHSEKAASAEKEATLPRSQLEELSAHHIKNKT